MRDIGTAFAVRYYRWALEWTISEAGAGFPRLFGVGNAVANLTVDFFEALSLSDRAMLARGLVNRFHPIATRALGIETAPDEAGLVAAKDDAVRSRAGTTVRRDRRPRLHLARLRALVEERVGAVAGRTVDAHTDALRFAANDQPAGWRLITHIFLSNEPGYVQYVRTAEPKSLAEGISILSWCGFSGQTVWDQCEGGDEEMVAISMARACNDFIGVWPTLMADVA